MNQTFGQKIFLTLNMIKFQHSIFAMPFALSMVFLATNGKPDLIKLLLIVLCMITARNAAMSFNRIADWKFDAMNPRTQNREIPNGKISLLFCTVFCLINCVFFIFLSFFFNALTFILSPVALIILLGYSLTKRFTNLTQIFLGLALGISSPATWLALTGEFSLFATLVGVGVLFWVAGFDLIYSTQDYEYDKSHNLKNIVVKLGLSRSLLLSRCFHALSIASFIIAGYLFQVSWIYFTGIGVMALFLIYEQSLVKSTDLSRVNMAFFALNGYVSMIFLATSFFEVYV